MPQRGRSHGLTLGTPVDLGQRQRSFGAHAMFSRTGAAPITFHFGKHEEGDPPCIRGSVFRSSQRLLPGLLLAPCWGLQVSLNPAPAKAVVYCQYVEYPAGCVAKAGVVLKPPPVARAASITPAAMQMGASNALEAGGKGLFRGVTSPWRQPWQAEVS